MPVERAQIVAAARTWIDTPFHHQGRKKGKHGAVDCVGLLAGVGDEVGLVYKDVKGYGRQPSGNRLVEELSKWLTLVDREALPGDVLVMVFDDPEQPHHVAFRTEYGILHAAANVGRVVEHRFTQSMKNRVSHVFEIPGVR